MLPRVTATGNLTKAPELRFTPSGKPVCNITLACNDRRKVGDRWEDGDTCFLDVTVWGEDAEVLATAVRKGAKVTVDGRLTQRAYETRDGDRRTVFEVVAQLVTLALPRGKSDRVRPNVPPIHGGDPWTVPTPAQPPGNPDDPWATPVGAAPVPPPF